MKVQTCMGAIETLSFTYDLQRVHSSCQYKCVYACVLVFASTCIDLRLCTVSIAATPRALALRGGNFSLHLHDFHQQKFRAKVSTPIVLTLKRLSSPLLFFVRQSIQIFTLQISLPIAEQMLVGSVRLRQYLYFRTSKSGHVGSDECFAAGLVLLADLCEASQRSPEQSIAHIIRSGN